MNTVKSKFVGLVTATAALGLPATLLPAAASADSVPSSVGSEAIITSSGAWIRPTSGGSWQLQVASSDQPKDTSVGNGYAGVITSSGAYQWSPTPA